MKNKARKKKLLKWRVVGLTITTLLAIPVMFFAGCSNNPIESTGATSSGNDSFWDQPFDPATLDGTNTDGAMLSSGSFTVFSGTGRVLAVDGGAVNLDMPGAVHNFTVPPNSIPTDTVINADIYVKDIASSAIILFGFGPDGLAFKQSATLSFDIGALSPNTDSVNLWWWNPVTGYWEFQKTVKADSKGVVSFGIDHFSMYGVE